MIDLVKVVSDNIHTVGWGTIMGFIAWAWRKSIKAEQKEKAGEQAIAQLNKMATNDFPHLQEGLTSLNEKHDRTVALLASIDKNISILVDRTPRG